MDRDEVIFFNFPIAMFEIVYQAPNLQKGFENFLNKVINYCTGQKMADLNCNLKIASEELGYTWRNNDYGDENTKSCFEAYNRYNDYKITTGIEHETLFQIRDNIKTYTARSLITEIAFLAVKSIVGKKKYAATNYEYILHRMAGGIGGEMPKVLQSYEGKRRRLERLIYDLEKHNVSYYSVRGQRGFYVSTTLPAVELAVEVEKYRKPSMAAKRKERIAKQKAAVARLKTQNEIF